MKKRTLLIIILIFVIIVANMIISEEEIKQVANVNYIDNTNGDDSYGIYLLEFDDNYINTNNINKIFDGIMILEIYPNNNKIYEYKMPKKYFINSSNYNDIVKFKNKYVQLLKLNGFNNQINSINIYGIQISKVKIYVSDVYVKKIISNGKIRILKKYV